MDYYEQFDLIYTKHRLTIMRLPHRCNPVFDETLELSSIGSVGGKHPGCHHRGTHRDHMIAAVRLLLEDPSALLIPVGGVCCYLLVCFGLVGVRLNYF